MSKALIENQSLVAIANAIRAKQGVTTQYKPGEMPAAILGIPASGTLLSKNITLNGTYYASSDNADGYSSVTVNVQASGGNIEEWTLNTSPRYTGRLHAIPLINSGVSNASSGVMMNTTSQLIVPMGWNGITIEIDVYSMNLSPSNHFITDGYYGLSYRGGIPAQWGFYGYNDSEEGWDYLTSDETFSGSTVKVVISNSGYWNIYKNDELWWAPSMKVKFDSGGAIYIGKGSGASTEGLSNAIISGIRVK